MSKELDNFIINECCNYIRGECIGISFTGMFNDTNICCIGKQDEAEPCSFFKDCVLPFSKYVDCYNNISEPYSKIDKTVK
mgnify:CR=1 FL=1